MLRWTSGVTKLDRIIIRNERIRGTWACIENRRRIHTRRQESDGDGGAREKKEMKTKAEVVGQYQEQLVGERIVRGGSSRPSSMEATHKKY